MPEIRQLLSAYYVDEPSTSVLQQQTIDKMIENLHDPHTIYLSPEKYKSLIEDLNLNYAGLGMVIKETKDYPIVDHTFPGSPAEKASLKSGDVIIKVNNESTKGMKTEDVAKKVRGPVGTTVGLVVQRVGGSTEEALQLKRQLINIPQVGGRMLGDQIGYISIDSFGDRAAEEFNSAYKKLQASGMSKLIIDLRGNGGGEVQAAEAIGDDILPEGPLYHIAGRKVEKATYYTEGSEKPLPMVVLVDDNTASASELLAGALRDRAHALLVGTKTYGKGSVQTILPLDSGGYLKMTIARYTTALDHPVDKIGLQPDQPVTYHPLQLIRAKELLLSSHQQTLKLSLAQPTAWLDDEEIPLLKPPQIVDDRAYVPLQFLGEALGGSVDYREKEKRAIVTMGGNQLIIPIAGGEVLLNDRPIKTIQPLIVQDEQPQIPLRLLSESLGFRVEYDGTKGEIRVRKV
ncbi:PDZ domain-containing protein [Heliobacillus mobilis]|uniref:PDZ domain-containing protein n=1 Tax=Heliobacterium mobile TaxID=28064 RepID=A0A6I3SBF4_HELMO|nr:S41 family peptidase [Heliobacterium mobile]MTV47423.1 PDZ domain-containing protein [Heliobacterium mobile]